MLNFREINYDKDLDEIVALIQKNLNPEFTRDFFYWKHVLNPAGKSYGLLALDEEKIIGLRMFMFWDFQHPEMGILKAIRPVDTVTDISYRGKGLFKKLTLEGLQRCENKYQIIFNTPNENSLPGYLKMGWQRFEEIKNFRIGIVNPFTKSLSFRLSGINDLQDIPAQENIKSISTFRNLEYLKWRYADPFYKLALFEGNTGFIIYKREKIRGVPAVKIYEISGKRANYSQLVNSLGKKLKAPVIYYYNSKDLDELNFLLVFNRDKPVVVYKNDRVNVQNSMEFSLGDLEGIL